MKKILFSIAFCTLMAGGILTSCNSPASNVEQAEKNVIAAKFDLAKAKQEYHDEIERFRKETESKFPVYEDLAAKAEQQRRKAEVDQRYEDLKKKLDEFRGDTREGWESFKAEFNRDMNTVGKALKDLTKDNVN